MVAFLISIVLVILLLFSIRIDYNDGILKKDFTNILKGFLIWVIVLHHTIIVIGCPKELYFMYQVGYLVTGIFFFISGYGNWISINKTQSVVWLVNRAKRIYIPFICFFLFFVSYDILSSLILRKSINLNTCKLVKDFAIMSLPNNINWFPKVFLLTILLLYILRKIVKNNKMCIIILTVSIIMFMALCYCVLNAKSYWYNSVLCFAFGCFVGEYKESVTKVVLKIDKKWRGIIGIVGTILFVVVVPNVMGDSLNALLVQPIHALTVCCMVIIISSVIVLKNSFFEFCGRYSLEILLINLGLWDNKILIKQGIIAYSLGVIFATLILVLIYSLIDKKIGFNNCIKSNN